LKDLSLTPTRKKNPKGFFENDDEVPAVKTSAPTNSRSSEVMPRIEFERVEETASFKAAFHDDVELVTTALFLENWCVS
jgi:hypothetical protein